MSKTLIVISALVLGVMLAGCGAGRQIARSPETDALLNAARAGHGDTVKSLLSGGRADVNGKDERGNTPLIEAARFGHNDAVQALLIAKADVRAKNDEGQTALALAVRGGHNEVVRLLRQAGASE